MTVPSHPWASVIVPIKDERDNLVPLIEGLLTVMNSHAASQTRPFEIIFVDDGSSDGSSEELDRLAAQHPAGATSSTSTETTARPARSTRASADLPAN